MTLVQGAAHASGIDWDHHRLEVARGVDNVLCDTVRISVFRMAGSRRERILGLRVDNVGRPEDATPWVSVHATSPGLIRAFAQSTDCFDATFSPPWKEVATGRIDAAAAPCVLIWRRSSHPLECGQLIFDLVHGVLGVHDPGRVRVSLDEVEGLEAHRRLSMVRRLRAAGHRVIRNVVVLGDCVRCGRELRDPESAAIGIGPECITYYSAADIDWLQRRMRNTDHDKPDAKSIPHWMKSIRTEWAV